MKLPLLLALLAVLPVSGQSPAGLLKDINRTPEANQNVIDEITPIDGGVVFFANDQASGDELWMSDGTARGTRMVKDIVPGSAGSHPRWFVPAGGKAFFLVGGQLWVTDGSETGTRQVTDLSGVNLRPHVEAGGRMLFSVDDGTLGGHSLWSSDGTVAGTFPLRDGATTAGVGFAHGFVKIGAWTYFIEADPETSESVLWRTDGTVTGTTEAGDLSFGPDRYAWGIHAGTQGLLVEVLRSSEWFELWSQPLDGGPAVRIAPGEEESWGLPFTVVPAGNGWIFSPPGPGLWFTDGTAEGTVAIDPLFPETTLRGLVGWNGEAVLTFESEGGGHEVWMSDGSAQGTRQVASFPDSSAPPAVRTNPTAGFLAIHVKERNGRWALWRSDGTAGSARRVRSLGQEMLDIGWGPGAVTSGDHTYFLSGIRGQGLALWRVRGKARQSIRLTRTKTGTAPAFGFGDSSVVPGRGGSEALILPQVSGEAYAPHREFELWRTKGTGPSTRAVWVPPVDFGEFGHVRFVGQTRGKTLMWLRDTTGTTRQLWVTDATRRGTRLVRDFSPTLEADSIGDLIEIGGVAVLPVFGLEIDSPSSFWITDGTAGGTMPLATADGTVLSPRVGEFEVLDGVLFFVNLEADGARTLWRTDGTTAGTWRVKRFPGAGDSPIRLTATGGRLAFWILRGTTAWLWTSDGTTAGTEQDDDSYTGWSSWNLGMSFDLAGRHVVFHRGEWLICSQSTGVFSRVAADGEEQTYYGMDENSGLHAVVGDTLFYTAITESSGAELWKTDGTVAGTSRVKDIHPGPRESQPTFLNVAGDAVYFAADDGIHGPELWRSDGTEAGTVMVEDVEPGPLGSFPRDMRMIGDKLYFHAERPATGRELHVLDLSPSR